MGSTDRAEPEARITRYLRWLAAERGLHFDATTTEGYDALWLRSVTDQRQSAS